MSKKPDLQGRKKSSDVSGNVVGENGSKISVPAIDITKTLAALHVSLQSLNSAPTPAIRLPPKIYGTLLKSNSTPASQVMIEVLSPSMSTANTIATTSQSPNRAGSKVIATGITDTSGNFSLLLPKGIVVPAGQSLSLRVRGASQSILDELSISPSLLGPLGYLGTFTLSQDVPSIPTFLFNSLVANLPVNSEPTPTPPPKIHLGDGQDCIRVLENQSCFDRFPYGIFFSLISPTLYQEQENLVNTAEGIIRTDTPYPRTDMANQASSLHGPISIDKFHEDLLSKPKIVGSLGLGYILRCAQNWSFKGLALGDLIYSLPLAPGEQQQIVVVEQQTSLRIQDTEAVYGSTQTDASAVTDSSTQATFQSAFNQAAQGGSNFNTSSETAAATFGGGLLGGIFGGPSGSIAGTTSGGSTTNYMDGSQNYASSAAQSVQTFAEQQSQSQRRAQRVAMRMATSSEASSVTTKTIANHNKLHALTFQYFEVLRLFDIKTVYEGVSLVCLVPLDVVWFLPPGQKKNLDDFLTKRPASIIGGGRITRQQVLNRYAGLLDHSDVLKRWLPNKYLSGFTRLEQFAADPRAIVELNSLAEDVINISANASVFPFDHLYVAAVTRWGRRLGPVEMIPNPPVIIPGQSDPSKAFNTSDDLINYLKGQRVLPGSGGNHGTKLQASLSLPPSLSPSDIIGFEITHSIDSFTYQLATPFDTVVNLFGANGTKWPPALFPGIFGILNLPGSGSISLTSTIIANQVGSPYISNFQADLVFGSSGSSEHYVNPTTVTVTELPSGIYPIPAAEISPIFKYSDLILIENALQHVLRNMIRYSKAVWTSLTPEERVMLLEPYILSFPGMTGSTVPLLECVGTEILGFYGNCMMLQFSIPRVLSDQISATNIDRKSEPITTGNLENYLLNFHNLCAPNEMTCLSLPTHGVLGEAMLGHCTSGEKIDLTRFWNWQDSPSDTAPAISTVSVPGSNVGTLAAAQTPNALSGMLPTLINNVNVPSVTPTDALATALAQKAPTAQFPDMTGATQLAQLIQSTQSSANQTLNAQTALTKDAIDQASAILQSILGGGGGSKTGSTGSSKSPSSNSGSGSGSNSGLSQAAITAIIQAIIAGMA